MTIEQLAVDALALVLYTGAVLLWWTIAKVLYRWRDRLGEWCEKRGKARDEL